MISLILVTSWAGVATLVTSGAAAMSAIAAVLMAVRNKAQIIEVRIATAEVHKIVNSTNKVLVERNEQLARMLQAAGVEIPASPDQSEGGP